MEILKKALITGLKVTIPVLLTFLILFWGVVTIESVFSSLIKPFIPDRLYFPGLGAIVGLALIFAIGFTINAWLVKKVHGLFERVVNRIPIVNTIYTSFQDFMDMLDTKNKEYGSPVMLEFQGVKMLGLVTRRTFEDLNCPPLEKEEQIAVYVPMSYQLGGFTIFVPASSVTPLDLSVQDAMKFIITAGLSRKSKSRFHKI